MVMPPCGTFQYAGAVPADWLHPRELWKLQDQSGAKPGKTANPMRDNRLVGLQPILEILSDGLKLTASDPHRAQVGSITLGMDPAVIQVFQEGDFLNLCRTESGNIGVSLLRAGQLLFAVGAVTQMPTGDAVTVRGGGPKLEITMKLLLGPSGDNWVDVSVSGETRRLLARQEAVIRDYRVSVLHCFEEGIPGRYECLSIALEGICPFEAAVRSAQFLDGPSGGFRLSKKS